MKVKTAYSQKRDINEIIADVTNQIGSFDAKLVQFYASSSIDPNIISAEIQKAFGKTPTIGCTTSGEIISNLMMDNSIVVMALGPDIISNLKIEVLSNLDSGSNLVDNAFQSFEGYFNTPMTELDHNKYVGQVLIDGLSGKEEAINERIGDLTNITFVGGSAGDDLKFQQTYLYANGKVYSNAAILILMECNTRFDIIKTQSFRSTGKKVVVTKVDEPKRTIIEMNGKPAVKEYSNLMGIEEGKAAEAFATNPLGLVFEDDFFVRSPQKTIDDSIVFYCSMKEGMELDILESSNIVEETRKDLKAKIDSFGDISAILIFNCILRTLELKNKEQTEDFAKLFSDIPTVGFSTYGESYIGHINQTATMLIFK